MGKKDIAEKCYTEDNRIFADIVNYMFFDGKETVRAEDLQELNVEEVFLEETEGKQHPPIGMQRSRDVLKRVSIRRDRQAVYVLVSLENQSEVHYAMPVRNMLNDAMRYMKQVDDKRRTQHYGGTPAEFLSGISKQDKLVPIVTIVILFQDQPWDGPTSLYEMLEDTDEEILRYVQDYKIHLIAPGNMDESEFEKFHSSMREVMGFIKYSRDKEQMKRLIQKDENRFHHMEREAIQLINLITGTDIRMENDEEVVDMCKAWSDMAAEEREIGYASGKEEGKAEGQRENKQRVIENMLKMGYPDDDILEIAECTSREINEIRACMADC